MMNTQTILTKCRKIGINTIVLDSLPDDVPAIVSRNPDDTFTIVLNGKYSFDRLRQEYLHELLHIEENHHGLHTADQAEKAVRAVNPNYGLVPVQSKALAKVPAKEQPKANKPGYLFFEAISWLDYYLELKAYLEQNEKYEEYLKAQKARKEVEKMIRKAERIERLKRKLEIDEYDPFEGYDFEAARKRLGLI